MKYSGLHPIVAGHKDHRYEGWRVLYLSEKGKNTKYKK